MSLQFGKKDIAAILRGPLALDMTVDGTCVRGFYDESESLAADMMGEPRKVRVITVRILSGCLDLTVNQVVTIDEVDYRLRDMMLEDDGAITALTLVREA